ncbi:MAG: divergent PAP2 family protein [Candidatus Krumholzibacteria bacterium]|nr:divergent PAP2 family protein [Candidatus Krumholzibacteria bacterium]MDH4336453.1 divergent PAP2 family protein [Candidatus Krumholzibacteria bacterium]MDH5269045.1 divergent PAP2 family protein [Candidatus Krumholzibacteria bacterium]MDH5627091.1 divergent PAP2 family protein [Candidatus Krumholzibacteria bacterium]
MFLSAISQPLLVGILGGLIAQGMKVVSFLLLEKRINFRRLLETDGAPNMHSAAFAALTVAIGSSRGFGSIEFGVAMCFTALVTVDMWNVKRAASRQAEMVELLVQKLRPGALARGRRALSYSVLDVLTGTAIGVVTALILG